jgi:hypothetical protein
MARDYYNDGFELAQQVRDAGYSEWASRLEETIEHGSTGTEILMGLRSVTGDLLSEVRDLPTATRGLGEELQVSIGELLGQD